MEEGIHLISLSQMFEVKIYCTNKWLNLRGKTDIMNTICSSIDEEVTCKACLVKMRASMDADILDSMLKSCSTKVKYSELFNTFNNSLYEKLQITLDHEEFETELHDALRRGYVTLKEESLEIFRT